MSDAGKTDGLGNPLVDGDVYYVQDTSVYVGDFMLWWKPNGNGYTCELREAVVYGADRCRGMRKTDIPWRPADLRIGHQTVVNVEVVRREHRDNAVAAGAMAKNGAF